MLCDIRDDKVCTRRMQLCWSAGDPGDGKQKTQRKYIRTDFTNLPGGGCGPFSVPVMRAKELASLARNLFTRARIR